MLKRTPISKSSWPVIAGLICALLMKQNSAFAFAGMIPGEGDYGACADYISTPNQYFRLPTGQVTFRITQNFRDRYPDAFSQYLVADSARLMSDFLNSQRYNWIDDIQDREHYLRLDKDYTMYGLKGILLHEFGHAMGLQHNDGCYYNTNQSTGNPWHSNFELIGGGNVAVTEPSGFEIMMGDPVADFLTPDVDVFDFMTRTYPFQSIDFVYTSNNNQTIRVDSTDAGARGGQTTITDVSLIDPDDSDQGWAIEKANIWVGYDNFIRYNYKSWYIENTSGKDIIQVTLRLNGTSTRKPYAETSPDEFTHLGIGTTSSPEQQIYSWTTPPGMSWPAPGSVVGIPGGNPNTEPPRFDLELDADDITLQEALMWANPNEAFEIAFPSFYSIKAWEFTPNTPPIEFVPPHAAAALPLSEFTSAPDHIELTSLPAAPNPNPGHGPRGFKLAIPQVDGVVFERIDVLKLSWADAEILMHLAQDQRASSIARQFYDRARDVEALLSPDGHHTINSLGFTKDMALFIDDPKADREQRVPLSKQFDLDLSDQYTYALRVVVSSPAARVYAFSVPELDLYMGSRKARCALYGDPESCCPYEMADPVRIEFSGSTEGLSRSSCIVGSPQGDDIVLNGRKPHVLATGGGDDKVRVERSESSVQLGQGDDYLETQNNVSAHVDGGPGKDTLIGSDQNDDLNGGAGNDILISGKGDDVLRGGPGENHIEAGPGNDTIYPGRGKSYVNAGAGDDRVIYAQVCELDFGAEIKGGAGHDTLVLPMKLSQAKALGLVIDGFEQIVEEVIRDSVIPNCD